MYPVHNESVILSACGIGKRFGARWLFAGLTINIEQGDCLIVTGRNGSGKSTLLKLLAGLERPTEGEIKTTFQSDQTDRAYCALDQAVFPALTVLEHLELAAEVRNFTQLDLNELIASVGLTEHKNHQAQHLSSGLRSRLKIALAIQSQPKLLIWDEPGVALDEAGRELVSKVVKEQLQRGALILATNDPEERRFGTHALEL
jgi:ABC-type multidrug transport system ATPase subunit